MPDVHSLDSLDTLLETIVNNENVVVVFSAMDWCINCKRLAPHIQAVAKELPDFLFLEVDVDHVEGIKEYFGLQAVPQVWFYEGDGVAGREIVARVAPKIIRELQS